MANGKVLLYDLPSKDQNCACWSLNPWKTRLALNYKGIDYETKWVEYPDVAPTLEALGLPPQEDADAAYTIPAVRFPDGTNIMDSKLIIDEIEKRFPTPKYPSLYLENPMTERVYTLVRSTMTTLAGVLMPGVPNILNDVSSEYFRRTRKSRFKMSLDELAEKNGGEKAWTASRGHFEKIAEALRETPGSFFLGTTFSYADIIVVSFLHFVRRVTGNENFQRLSDWPEIIALYEASGKWFERDTY